MRACLRGSKSLLTLYQIINETCFPSLADEIAKPHPDMNIKVAAFTVSEKSSNTIYVLFDIEREQTIQQRTYDECRI